MRPGGTGSLAQAIVGNFDTALADGDHSNAYAGGNDLLFPGNDDFASAWGPHTIAVAGSDVVSVGGNNDVALALDPLGTVGSEAMADQGNFDLAALFGDMLNAVALGNFMTDILPML